MIRPPSLSLLETRPMVMHYTNTKLTKNMDPIVKTLLNLVSGWNFSVAKAVHGLDALLQARNEVSLQHTHNPDVSHGYNSHGHQKSCS